jgi:hypothetical protein
VANIALDFSGNAWVAGTTSSNYYPVLRPIGSSLQQNYYPESDADAFVTQLNASGIATFSTYLGGSFTFEPVAAVVADNSGNAYLSHGLRGSVETTHQLVDGPAEARLVLYDNWFQGSDHPVRRS